MMIQNLENRRLLSTLFSVSIENGVLTVHGSVGRDTITLSQANSRMTVQIGDAYVSKRIKSIKSVAIHGDAGNDRITADVSVTRPVRMYGGNGSDRLTGSNSACTLSGEAGNDTLIGGTGRDLFEGGGGADTVSYASRVNPVFVSLDGEAEDGQSGEKDNVMSDVEIVIGGAGADQLTGDDSANTLIGGAGNDTLIGLGGNDVLTGGMGNDSLDGGLGDDILIDIDLSPADTLNGGAGFDGYAFDSVLGAKDKLIDLEVELSMLET